MLICGRGLVNSYESYESFDSYNWWNCISLRTLSVWAVLICGRGLVNSYESYESFDSYNWWNCFSLRTLSVWAVLICGRGLVNSYESHESFDSYNWWNRISLRTLSVWAVLTCRRGLVNSYESFDSYNWWTCISAHRYIHFVRLALHSSYLWWIIIVLTDRLFWIMHVQFRVFIFLFVACENKLRIEASFTNLLYMVIRVVCISIESSQLFVWCISKWVACSKISLRYRGLYSR